MRAEWKTKDETKNTSERNDHKRHGTDMNSDEGHNRTSREQVVNNHRRGSNTTTSKTTATTTPITNYVFYINSGYWRNSMEPKNCRVGGGQAYEVENEMEEREQEAHKMEKKIKLAYFIYD